MPNNVTPDGTFTVTVQSPADGEFVTGASVLTPVQALTNRTSFIKADLDALNSGSAGSYRYIRTTRYTLVATGSHTYDSRANLIQVHIVAGGGGGGGCDSGAGGASAGGAIGGGGSAGNYHVLQFLKGSQTGSTYFLGQGGNGGNGGSNGQPGDPGQDTVYFTPTGKRAAQGGNGGTGSGTTLRVATFLSGGTGGGIAPSESIFNSFGTPGGHGVYLALPNSAVSGTYIAWGGYGGNNMLGGGAHGRPNEGNGFGGDDNTGGGGSGAHVNSTTARNGGAGGTGLVMVVEWQ